MKALALAAALLLPLATAAEEAAPPAPRPVQWKGTAGVGLIVLTGNSDTTTFTGSAGASRETLGWILSAKAAAAYGENRAAGDGGSQVSAYAAGGQVRLDRKFGDTWTVFVIGGLETDHVASVEYRTISELGVGAQWLDRKTADWQRLALRSDLGLRYGYEARYLYYGPGPPPPATRVQQGVELVAPRLGVAFRYGFSKEVFFTGEAEALTSLSGESRWLAKSVAKLSSRLSRALTLGVSYSVAFDSRPAAAKEKTDTALTVLLEVGF